MPCAALRRESALLFAQHLRHIPTATAPPADTGTRHEHKLATIITPSRYEWERRGLDFIRARFPTHDPYRAWPNFEFQAADGAIYEADLLVLTKQGFWLKKLKANPGRVAGDTGTWIGTHNNRRFSDDNPVLLANRKAKALAALLGQQPACRKGQLPWLDALVFLSDPDIQCDLRGPARHRVCLTDRE